MNDIDELIERLQEWAENEPDLTGYGGKVLKEAITALQEMQQHIAELENDNQELANAIEETDKLNSERIAELEEEVKRLDAALDEIKEYFGRDFDRYYGLVEIYRKARETK
jgi:CHASE3 domain sensor protein